MTSPIDPIRRAALLRRAARPETDVAEDAPDSTVVNLPVPVGRASRVPPRADPGDGASIFAAQLMGQEGQRRGLRAGPAAIDSAKSAYNKTEWSGAKDRRSGKGRAARTDV